MTCPLIGPEPGDVLAVEIDRALADRMLPDQRAQQAGLADAVASKHAGYLARLRHHGHAAQHLRGAIV
jgi:hypothetical protein